VFWWPGNDRRACVVRVRERGIASAQEAASNTPLLAAGFFILVNPVANLPLDFADKMIYTACMYINGGLYAGCKMGQ
jgi:hypothetical protein